MLHKHQVDELLDPVFRVDLQRLLENTGSLLHTGRQTALVSATLTPRILSKTRAWVKDNCELLQFKDNYDEFGRPGGSMSFQRWAGGCS